MKPIEMLVTCKDMSDDPSMLSRRIVVRYLKKCLLEIKARLGPLTKELGLQHKLGRGHCDDWCLFFERTDADGVVWRAPVNFTFPPRSETGQQEITWDNVRIGLVETVVEKIGTNGWVSFVGNLDLEGLPIGAGSLVPDVDAAFAQAAEYLRQFPLFPEDINLSGVVDDGDLADFWKKLEPECQARGIEQIDVGRNNDGDEFYSFCYEGSNVEILYRGDETAFLIDGEVRARSSKNDIRNVLLKLKTILCSMEVISSVLRGENSFIPPRG